MSATRSALGPKNMGRFVNGLVARGDSADHGEAESPQNENSLFEQWFRAMDAHSG